MKFLAELRALVKMNQTSLNHFIDYNLWKQAVDLLEYQISAQKWNPHFKTMSMIHYGNLENRGEVLKEEYFHNRVGNNLFYALENEFFSIPYVVPKSSLGLRKYKFLSYPFRVAYYAIGLYMLKLTEDLLTQGTSDERDDIASFYGGNICFEGDCLKLGPSVIYYRKHYLKFKETAEREAHDNAENKIVINLDIQNYFENITLASLLDLIAESALPQTMKKMNFDATTRDQIMFFFRFLMRGEGGIPQTDNDIVSSFLGYLYMVFGDYIIRDALRASDDYLQNFRIIRYVDDVYVSLEFKNTLSRQQRKRYTHHISNVIADMIFYKLGLRLNTKTRIFELNSESEDFDKSLKNVSPDLALGGDNLSEDPQRALEKIFEQIEMLKKEEPDENLSYNVVRDVLGNVFDKRVIQLLNKEDNINRIHEIFKDFDFEKTKALPLPIILLIIRDETTEATFQDYLHSKDSLTTGDVDLILKYLCQHEFNKKELMSKLKETSHMQEIAQHLNSKSLNLSKPGYFEIYEESIMNLASNHHVIEQARQRVINERLGHYSVALNHLLNEVHAIVFSLDKAYDNFNVYKREDVVNYLDKCGLPFSIYNSIRKLFDRRNANPISHPGHDDGVAWSVSPSEYWEYHDKVKNCLNKIMEPY